MRCHQTRANLEVAVSVLALFAACYGFACGGVNGERIEGWLVVANAVRGMVAWPSTPVRCMSRSTTTARATLPMPRAASAS